MFIYARLKFPFSIRSSLVSCVKFDWSIFRIKNSHYCQDFLMDSNNWTSHSFQKESLVKFFHALGLQGVCSTICILDYYLPNEEKTDKTFPANICNYDSMFWWLASSLLVRVTITYSNWLKLVENGPCSHF